MWVYVGPLKYIPLELLTKKALIGAIFMVPLIFASCSIFKSKPYKTATRDRSLDQIYKSQRTKKPDLSIPRSSHGNPPFWYRNRRTIPKTLPSQSESNKSLSTKTPIPDFSFKNSKSFYRRPRSSIT